MHDGSIYYITTIMLHMCCDHVCVLNDNSMTDELFFA